MTDLSLCACILVVVLASGSSIGAASPSLHESPSKAQIVATIDSQRSLLSSLVIESTSHRLSGPDDAVAFSRDRFAQSGSAFLFSSMRGGDPEGGIPLVRVSWLWDGERGLQFASTTKQAHTGPAEDVSASVARELLGNDLFGAMAWFPVAEAGTAHQDLRNILASDHSAVRNELVEFEGGACAVVDGLRADGSVGSTFWLSLDRGMLPVKQEYYAPDGALLLRRSVSDFLTMPNGAWLPLAGERLAPAFEGSAEVQYRFEIARDGTNAPIASTHPSSDEFEWTTVLPIGTRVFDPEGGAPIMVVGHPSPMHDSAHRVASVAAASGVGPSSSWLGWPGLGRSIGVLGLAALAGGLLALMWFGRQSR
jgi:hypothetical protein